MISAADNWGKNLSKVWKCTFFCANLFLCNSVNFMHSVHEDSLTLCSALVISFFVFKCFFFLNRPTQRGRKIMYCHTSRHLMITSLFVKHLEVTAVGTRRYINKIELTWYDFWLVKSAWFDTKVIQKAKSSLLYLGKKSFTLLGFINSLWALSIK